MLAEVHGVARCVLNDQFVIFIGGKRACAKRIADCSASVVSFVLQHSYNLVLRHEVILLEEIVEINREVGIFDKLRQDVSEVAMTALLNLRHIREQNVDVKGCLILLS